MQAGRNLISQPNDSPLSLAQLDIRVRYSECDPMGYLHHARYFEFFELGRTELMRSAGHAYRDMEASGHFLVVARAQCKFMKPAKYDDRLVLTTRLQRVTAARIDHAYELNRDGQRLCTAATTLACIDSQGRLACVPEYIRTKS